jgi:hypothetical protein
MPLAIDMARSAALFVGATPGTCRFIPCSATSH